jgi:hypothetical protein
MVFSSPSVRPGLGLLAVLVLTSALQAQSASLKLTPIPESFVRFGDTVAIFATTTNPTLETFGAYQLFYGFDADHFDLAGPPYLDPMSSMTAFFGWNAPPPVGTGWLACPETSDGLGHDYLGALGVQFPPYPPPQPSHILYAADFTAGQSSGPAPLDFVISEFDYCAPESLVADDSAMEVPATFTDAAVEIVPNVALGGTVAVGQTFSIEIRDLPGNPFVIALGTATSSLYLGSKGTLYIEVFDPSKPWLALWSDVMPPSSGVSVYSLPLAIPSNPIFVGLDVHFQVITGAGPAARLSNLASATVQ